MVAHRGVSGLERENSIAAFIAAGNRSHAGIETDVHVTKDGQFVIIHDSNAERVTGKKMVIEESTFDEIRQARLLSTEADAPREDLVIPTLADYIAICRKYDKIAVLELKNRMPVKALAGIASLIRSMSYFDKTIFISFSFENLVDLRVIEPTATVQFLVDEWTDDLPTILADHEFDLDIGFTKLTKERLDACHDLGMIVNVWTPNEKEDGQRLADWGVDFITSNILESEG